MGPQKSPTLTPQALAEEAVALHGANQHPGELGELGRWLVDAQYFPGARVLEIGCLYGGTLWYWRQLGAHAIGVDVDHEGAGVIVGNSTDPTVVESVRRVTQSTGLFDVLHIDGGHDLETAILDVTNYVPMLAARSVLLVHDVAGPDWPELASEFWPSLRRRWPQAFTIHHEDGMGIGVVPFS